MFELGNIQKSIIHYPSLKIMLLYKILTFRKLILSKKQ